MKKVFYTIKVIKIYVFCCISAKDGCASCKYF